MKHLDWQLSTTHEKAVDSPELNTAVLGSDHSPAYFGSKWFQQYSFTPLVSNIVSILMYPWKAACSRTHFESRSMLPIKWAFVVGENIKYLSSGQCACTGNHQENSHACSGQGALVCGKCQCYEPYIGQQCEWNLESTDRENEDGCRSGPNAPVCSARGACIFGFCECNIRENPEEKYSGQYCECSNFNCPFRNNRYDMG